MISRDEADRALTGLGAAHDQIAAAMYALDGHPALEVLRTDRLTGETESRWRVLRPEVDLLWAHFTALGEVLEQARAVRARPRLDDAGWTELAHLLREPVVPLGPDGMPVDITVPPASRLSMADLARGLEQRCAGVLTHLSEVDSARTAVATALVRAAGEVIAAVTLASQLGEAAVADRLRAAQTEAEQDLTDPLAAAPGGRLSTATQTRLDHLRDWAADARRELDGVVRLRDGYPDRRASLAASVEAVAAAEQDAAHAYRRAMEKIVDPALGPLPATAPLLRARLPELDRLAQQGQWRTLTEEVSTAESLVRAARDRARELGGLADGLLARRDELRGRLEAYRSKAAARGLAEHAGLASGYTDAHGMLYAAPCDLRAATRAVRAYQQALADVLGTAERSQVDD